MSPSEIKKNIMWNQAQTVGTCMLRNSLITFGMVAVALGFVVKNKKYKPLIYFSALAISGDLVSGYCINCRTEIQEFKNAKQAYEKLLRDEENI